MRLKDLHADQKNQIVSSLRFEVDAFRAMQTQVELNETTLPRLHDSLADAQRRISAPRSLPDGEGRMIIKTAHRIEGLNPDGEWHPVGQVFDESCDHLAQRDETARKLREHGITRYSKIRLAKYVTTVEVIGEDISV